MSAVSFRPRTRRSTTPSPCCVEGREQPLTRIGKAAKDFLTEVDLAAEAAMKSSLAASTPDIGFYGEEGGGADCTRGACGSPTRSTARSTTRPARRCAA